MKLKHLLNRRLFGIRFFEYAFVMGFYGFFAFSYYLTLWVNSTLSRGENEQFFDFIGFMNRGGLDYTVKLILSIPIWWLVFRRLRHLKLPYRLIVHVVSLPLWVFTFQKLYYALCEALGFFHLYSYGQVWDIYIPMLFYIVQFGILHVYEHYHELQRSLKLKASLKEAALKSELSALKAQLNPHFLYNVFNTINASVPPGQEKTRELVAELSDLFRYQLKASQSELVPLREELAFVRKYLSLEKARFEERLQIVIDVPEEVMAVMVPPMILQPLVENAVKHGIANHIDGGAVSISVRRKGEAVHFEVTDTGSGVADTSALFGKGIGLTNTRLRLEKQFGSQLKLSNNHPSGLKVEFAI